jgi:hypothetical protein
MLRLLEL